jgi:hypothetical protein
VKLAPAFRREQAGAAAGPRAHVSPQEQEHVLALRAFELLAGVGGSALITGESFAPGRDGPLAIGRCIEDQESADVAKGLVGEAGAWVSASVVATGRVDRSTVAAIRDALVGGGAERREMARLHSVGVIFGSWAAAQ